MAGEQPVEQGGADITHMGESGGAGGIANTDWISHINSITLSPGAGAGLWCCNLGHFNHAGIRHHIVEALLAPVDDNP